MGNREVASEPLEQSTLEIRKPSGIYLCLKRAMDLSGAIVGLIIFSPIFLLISILYMTGDNKGPVFFKQIRMGKNGKEFYIYKFRSMIVNAEEKLRSNEVLYKKYIDNNYKLEPDEDPRITKVGQFLRKTSLDELPQFLNVLKGDMSLVGPRPVVQEELIEYGKRKDEFLSVKPGLTGYWQVSGRSDVGYPERVELELHYIYNCSILFDMKIIFLTMVHVIMRKGAY
ncbi:sugar transferase [Bacillus thuringiensis]|uniref:Undecaprenyl-phosphate galactosephosphotransferase n=2 Tax=Bacillus thuringiensis TaxID=1428 RepID=A0A9W3PJ11_BACTU|nr:sugar transferase [Bacillus thuringiensis]AHA75039.1 Undecaprenyl-phosphate galactosephosphotransferase [Bacillus thuringiensis YBT-1518]MBG9483347.1 multidrug MFS transporter [Bacillus thuringiensis]MBG9493061.1 multidrug MFS transporter [Bacillus thuringiensis]MBG9500497.1 multidrug MFS transporter [Bacillus thuringiensis]MBG9507519.1 multidrug MFS transporter [Bacillus thuringiensis]